MTRYTQLPNQTSEDEMEAAFNNSDDEEDDEIDDSHDSSSRPLLSRSNDPDSHPLQISTSDQEHTPSRHSPTRSIPGAYDFEYDYASLPPPGSPPRPSTLALPNSFGNTNGQIPESSPASNPVRRPNILRRAFGAILPTHYAHDERGGGLGNDGVFGNVVAKPGGPAPVRGAANSEGPYWVPEETQKDAPPTYQSAQADSVPPYWENTILAPSGPLDGDMVIDSLPVGSVFAFLWNLLVSVSFQFVGFLLTYLLHNTHASKYGSRAGLGITLIQYGFYMRSADVTVPVAGDGDGVDSWSGWPEALGGATPDPPNPSPRNFIPHIARALIRAVGDSPFSPFDPTNSTTPTAPDPASGPYGNAPMVSPFTPNDWISFMLMTIGWFILITSFLGFWRVKRWERGVQQSVMAEREPTQDEIVRDAQVMRNIEQAFGLWGLTASTRPRDEEEVAPTSTPPEQRHSQTSPSVGEGDSSPDSGESGGAGSRRGRRTYIRVV